MIDVGLKQTVVILQLVYSGSEVVMLLKDDDDETVNKFKWIILFKL